MQKRTQEERILDMMKLPVPRKRVGIVHLEMVRESRTLYGMKRFQNPKDAAELVRPLCEKSDREMMLVLSLNGRLEPQAVEIAAVGGVSSCSVDIRSIFKHALLSNAEYVICFHNHPSGDPEPSREDELLTGRIRSAGELLGVELVDHIILGEGNAYYSFRDHGRLMPPGRRTKVPQSHCQKFQWNSKIIFCPVKS